ncbi:MAG: alanine--tRNA ligase [bacterium]
MKSSEIRKKFLKYFESKGHKVLPGSSLVPADPTVLLTLAGMLQFKPIFLGQEKPMHNKATTVQKCIRTNDIERVGHTLRHQTFFEMLGNFSFGAYFKEDAIKYAWEFLTEVCKLPKDRLSAAVFEKDDEAVGIWEQQIKLPKEKIFRLDEENNFWAVGPTGPCGPCSEIYYDLGVDKGCGQPNCQPGCDCDRFLEVWNLVFIQYNRDSSGKLIPLQTKGIDTGMGLERLSAVLQGVDSNFETDLFTPLIEKVKKLAKQPNQASLWIVADHVRAVTNLISDGVMPGNAGREYVLRRLIRRAVRHGRLLGIDKPFLVELAKEVIKQMKDAYLVLHQMEKTIIQVVQTEENNFLSTLEQGLALFQQIMEQHKQDKLVPGEVAFKLHDTYGFPIDLSKEIAAEAGYKIDEAGFEKEMEKQKERARSAGIPAQKKQRLATLDLSRFKPTKFEGYETTELQTKIIGIFPAEKLVILEKSPFYGESGGQTGDTGIISDGKHQAQVVDTLITPQGTIIHEVDNVFELKEKAKVTAKVDPDKRQATAIHHTATHLLHKALREVLGEHVKQAGSYVGPDKLRFDFNHLQALSIEELSKVEALINQKIKENLNVEVLQKSYQDAVKMGATALFGEKYGDKVRVLKIADYSMELCGGTHINSTGEIKFFKISSEGALGAGVRRIEALGGQAAIDYVVSRSKDLCNEAMEMLMRYKKLETEKEKLGGKKFSETGIFAIDCTEQDAIVKAAGNQDSVNVNKFLEHLEGRVDWLRERIAKADKEIKGLKLNQASSDVSAYVEKIEQIAGVPILLAEFTDYNMEMLRTISDEVRNQAKSCVIVLASNNAGKVSFLITVTQDLIEKGQSAKKIADTFAPIVGGRGGGRDDKVEGGGKDPAKINEALAAVRKMFG